MKKLRFYKQLLIEIVETLCTICLFLSTEARKYGFNSMYDSHFRSHFDALKNFSEIMRRGKI